MSHMPCLNQDGRERLDTLLLETVGRRQVPAVFFGATNAEQTLYQNQAGEVHFGDSRRGDVNEETTMALYSCTKLITSVAALQLVDRELVGLDSTEDIALYLPELVALPLLSGYDADGESILRRPKNKVTLRMLLSHSAGTAYAHREPLLREWLRQNPRVSLFETGGSIQSLCTPFIYEPGTSWRYSNALDWVGVLIERLSRLTLEEYFRRHIFEPCGSQNLTFFPSDEVRAHQMTMCIRDPRSNVLASVDGGIGFGRPSCAAEVTFLSGGAGLYGTQKDYLAVLRGILRSDASSASYSKYPLLSPESYAALFQPALQTGEGHDGCEKLALFMADSNFFDEPPSPTNISHSIGCMINLDQWTGRRAAGSGCWSGTGRTQWWIDSVNGLACEGICATQLKCAAPDLWYDVYVSYERGLYASLASRDTITHAAGHSRADLNLHDPLGHGLRP